MFVVLSSPEKQVLPQADKGRCASLTKAKQRRVKEAENPPVVPSEAKFLLSSSPVPESEEGLGLGSS